MYAKIFTVVSLAVAATAAPSLVARATKNEETQQQRCGNNQELKCCNSFQQSILNLVPIQLGINCVDLDREFPSRPTLIVE